ncbi:unnamed protein product [Adineta steineri]|uniref:Non-specific protein-tyrosine kinase n=2 Tax=Adineta steineri TaxID=433720 RepID=A0A819XJB2_9BILA|nr:unnamed protein product [Adineta steineri]CAF4140454.1 unnamed protein product [Adineta steineri]
MKTPEDALSCPITLELFRDPVVAQDGHTYERKAIEEWIRKYGTSPLTNQQLSLEHLVSNYAIKKVIDHFETSSLGKNFQYILDKDVKKKKGRPLFQTTGKTIYHAEWLPTNNNRPEIVLLKIEGARANKEASFYVDLSRHPHIVRTFGLVRDDGDDNKSSIMMLQEYASEGSLYELLTERKNPLDEEILFEILLQIIDAMSYLALNNVVHGDLACRNVLVFRFDEKDPRNIVVKVTDFGLSRYSKIYSQTSTAAQTALNIIPIRYCAPEILSQNVTVNDYTEKSDVYSMGVLMWEAYSRGAVPWTNIERDDDIIRKVRNGDMLPQPKNCSSKYWNIITKTWAKLPNQRPTFNQLKELFKEQPYQPTTSVTQPSSPSYYKRDNGSPAQQNSLPGIPSYYLPDKGPPAQQSSSPGAANNIDTDHGTESMHLLGTQINVNKQKCIVKGRVNCGTDELYALESDKPLSGYDGLCPKCRTNHVMFDDPSRGFYMSVKNAHEIVIKQKLDNERLKGRKDIPQLTNIVENLPPLDQPILGKNKGIEGDSNSTYIDATIFCMFAYNNVFDKLLHMEVKTEPLKILQKVLRETIVHVLRDKRNGFVQRDALFHLRLQLSEATHDPSFKEMEKDPSEFLRAFETLFHYAPLKTISPDQPPKSDESNITTNIIWEMFDANPHRLPSTNIASIFRNSLSEIPAKLATIPPFLVLVAPRHTRSQRSYRYIIPDREITLDNSIVQLVCLKCQKTNHDPEISGEFYFCNECHEGESATVTTDAIITCYCTNCLSDMHKNLVRSIHTHHTKRVSSDKTKLNLFAVLCIETSHYVAFVKCQERSQFRHEWLFFDSMSDRMYDEQNVPLVDSVSEFDRWIDDAEKGKDDFFNWLDDRRGRKQPTSNIRQLRLFRDGAFFFYENTNMNY